MGKGLVTQLRFLGHVGALKPCNQIVRMQIEIIVHHTVGAIPLAKVEFAVPSVPSFQTAASHSMMFGGFTEILNSPNIYPSDFWPFHQIRYVCIITIITTPIPVLNKNETLIPWTHDQE